MSDIEQGTWSGVDKEPPPRSDEDRQFAEWCCTRFAFQARDADNADASSADVAEK
jgi:hypothetical protein